MTEVAQSMHEAVWSDFCNTYALSALVCHASMLLNLSKVCFIIYWKPSNLVDKVLKLLEKFSREVAISCWAGPRTKTDHGNKKISPNDFDMKPIVTNTIGKIGIQLALTLFQ